MITDDDLLLYYYRELDAAERARIATAVSDDPQLARRLHALVARLDAAAASEEIPVPEATQQRWQEALDRAATEKRAAPAGRRVSTPWRWQLAAAAVAVVALVVTFQVMQSKPASQTAGNTLPPESHVNASGAEASAYEQGLKVHLASTEQQLAGLDAATPEERARLLETIISQNRMYALAAERAGEPQLARVLRAFNPILEDLADGRADTTAADISQLSFELRVMQARLSAGAPPSNIL